MANERNAGRKLKYGEKMVQITFSVPTSKKEDIRDLVREKLTEYALKIKDSLEGKPKRIKYLYESITYPCGCVLKDNLLRKAKGCELGKEEHFINP